MEAQLLRDKNVLPGDDVLAEALGSSYAAFQELMGAVTDPTYGLTVEWRYYSDGSAWLCKVCFKKKTIFWLSVWDTFFKVSFFFTEKNCAGIASLGIDESIKAEFGQSKPIGRLIPLVISVSRKEQISDVVTLVEYKKRLK